MSLQLFCYLGLFVVTLITTACNKGSASSPAGASASPSPRAAPVFAPTQQPGQPCIESMVMRDGKFAPERLAIPVNCAVLFTNRDDTPVQIQGHDFTLGEMGKDQAWAHTYKEPGSFEIFNAKNPTQRAAILVRP